MGAKMGGPGGGRFTIAQNSDINVTPFVDVMLVLLIIFMVSAPLATVSIKLDLPPATPPPPGTPPEEPTYISIQESGSLYIGTVETGIDTLPGDLARIVGGANPTEERIFIRADPNVRYVSFMEVMNTLQDGGFYSVALVGEDLSGT